jgi:hypothetical protein
LEKRKDLFALPSMKPKNVLIMTVSISTLSLAIGASRVSLQKS